MFTLYVYANHGNYTFYIYHIDISTICVITCLISHVYDLQFPCWEVEWLTVAWPLRSRSSSKREHLFETTSDNRLIFATTGTFCIADILNDTIREFPAVIMATKTVISDKTLAEISAVFVARKPGILRQNKCSQLWPSAIRLQVQHCHIIKMTLKQSNVKFQHFKCKVWT